MTRSRKAPSGRRRCRLGGQALEELSDTELLELRFCDLDLRIEGTTLEHRIERLHDELDRRHIDFRPHFWLSEEWFTPDGVPGVAIPFYLAHPRLMRLEGKQMLEVEGGSEESCMRILRHETGHAIDNAYRLRRRRRWRDVFGPASQPYPESYVPRPISKKHVLHLGMWYAQSHPVEDFAETFAVWLRPRSRWRTDYRGWPALRKLEFVDSLIREIRHAKPKVISRKRVEPLWTLRKTLREHYNKRRAHYGIDVPGYFDRDLRRMFSNAEEHRSKPSAVLFLRRYGPEIRRAVANWTGQHQYTIDQVLNEMIGRCRELKLRVHRSKRDSERDAFVLVAVHTMNYLYGGRHGVAL